MILNKINLNEKKVKETKITFSSEQRKQKKTWFLPSTFYIKGKNVIKAMQSNPLSHTFQYNDILQYI